MTKQQESPAFEENLKELEKLVTKLEEGDLALEDSIKVFEQGVNLVRDCQIQLDDAKLRVDIINQDAMQKK